MKQCFNREIGSLEAIFGLIGRFVSEMKLDDGLLYSMNLAGEELFTNMIKYNSSATDQIQISLDRSAHGIVLQLIDFDVDPFDPQSVEEVNVDMPLEERRPGGLGLHLVKSIVDKISFEYKDRQMTVTAEKNLE